MKSIYLSIIILVLCVIGCATGGSQQVQGEDFTVTLDSPYVTIGEFNAQFIRGGSLNALAASRVTVLYFPLEDAVCLQFNPQGMTYYQFWSRTGRQLFLDALASYNEDFETRNLPNSRNTRRNYGITRGYLVWQQYDFSVQASGNMDVQLGYTFNNRLPYFTINQMEAQFIHRNIEGYNRDSQIITMFFTRAQAAEMAELIQPQVLREAAAYLYAPRSVVDVSYDEY